MMTREEKETLRCGIALVLFSFALSALLGFAGYKDYMQDQKYLEALEREKQNQLDWGV